MKIQEFLKDRSASIVAFISYLNDQHIDLSKADAKSIENNLKIFCEYENESSNEDKIKFDQAMPDMLWLISAFVKFQPIKNDLTSNLTKQGDVKKHIDAVLSLVKGLNNHTTNKLVEINAELLQDAIILFLLADAKNEDLKERYGSLINLWKNLRTKNGEFKSLFRSVLLLKENEDEDYHVSIFENTLAGITGTLENWETIAPAAITDEKKIEVLEWCGNRLFNAPSSQAWSLAAIYHFRTQILNNVQMKLTTKSLLLSYLDRLEEEQVKIEEIAPVNQKPQPLWQARVNPISLEEITALKNAIDKIEEHASKQGENPTEGVLVDVFRVNGRLEGNEFVTDIYFGNSQLKFDVSSLSEEFRNPNHLIKDQTVIEHWKDEVKEITKNNALISFINYATNQNLLTHMPFTLLKELLQQQFISTNPFSLVENPKYSVRISARDDATLVYHLYYEKYEQESGEQEDKQGRLIYSVSSDVIVTLTDDSLAPYKVEIADVVVSGFDAHAQHILPNLHNRAFLERQLADISITKIGRHVLNSEEKRQINSAIKCAIRFSSEYVIDKLSCWDFEAFVPYIKQKLIEEVRAKKEKNVRVDFSALRITRDYLREKINSILHAEVSPHVENNLVILSYFLKDIEVKGEKSLAQKQKDALDKFGREYAQYYSMSDFSELLSSVVNTFKKMPSNSKEKDFYTMAKLMGNKDKFYFSRFLYESLDKNERRLFETSLGSYVNKISLEDHVDIKEMREKYAPHLLVRSIVSSQIKVCVSRNKRNQNYQNILIDEISKFIVPVGVENQNLFRLLSINGRENIKNNIQYLVDEIYSKFDPSKMDQNEIENEIERVFLNKIVKWQIDKDLNSYRNGKNLERLNQDYVRVLKLVNEGFINIDTLYAGAIKNKNKSTRDLLDDDIRDAAVRYVASVDTSEYLEKIIREELGKINFIEEVIEDFVPVFKSIFIESIGKDLLPVWGNEKYIRAITNIIYGEVYENIHHVDDAAKSIIVEKARRYVVTDILENDLKEKTSNPVWPELYAPVVLTAMRNNRGGMIKQEFVSMVLVENKNKNLGYSDIRSQVTNLVLRKDVNYSNPLFSDLIKAEEKEFSGKLKQYKLSERQIIFMSEMSALYKLYEKRCSAMFGSESEMAKKAKEIAEGYGSDKVKAFYTDSAKQRNYNKEKVFNQYVLKAELSSRPALEFLGGQADEIKEIRLIESNAMAMINKYRYCNEKSKFFDKTFKTVDSMLADRNIFLTDFDDKWFGDVDKQVKVLLNGKSARVEKQLAELESLLTQGREFAKGQGFLTRYILNGKLDKLEQFIEKFKEFDAYNEAKLISFRIKQESDKAEQGPVSQVVAPSDKKKIGKKKELESDERNRRIKELGSVVEEQQSIYSNAHFTVLFANIKDKKSLKDAIKNVSKEIVTARMNNKK